MMEGRDACFFFVCLFFVFVFFLVISCTQQSVLQYSSIHSQVLPLPIAVLTLLFPFCSCSVSFSSLLCIHLVRLLKNNEVVSNLFAVWTLCLTMKLVHLNLNSKGAFIFNSYPRKTYIQSLLKAFTSFHFFMKNLLILWSMSKKCISNLWSFHHHFCRGKARGKYHLCHWNDA